MSSAAMVLACVLTVLGRSQASLPPIQLLDSAPPEAHPKVEALVGPEGTIQMITSSLVFRAAAERPQSCHTPAMKKLASIIVHEERHIKYGDDEREAYHAQLTTLASLGLTADTAIYQSVVRSMLEVKRAEKYRRRNATFEGLAAVIDEDAPGR